MRIYVLTQEDAFYIPLILDHVLDTFRDVVGIGIVPGELRSRNLRRYLKTMGARDFVIQSLNLVRHRFMDRLGGVVGSTRSWSVAGAARRAGVAREAVPRVNDPVFLGRLRAAGVDLIVSIACPQRLGPELLRLPSRGCINLHGALLPRYQGMLPSFWVLANGEATTGVTVHWMDEQIDRGDILVQQSLSIEPWDTVHSLVRRSKVLVGRQLLVSAIGLIERGQAPRTPMDHAKASYYSYPDADAVRRFRAHGRRFI
jgi:methionyl-tRNA formyltransferase